MFPRVFNFGKKYANKLFSRLTINPKEDLYHEI